MAFVSQSVVLAEFKMGNKKEVVHGIVFRDNNKLGLVIPNIRNLKDEQSVELTINAPGQYKQELEFSINIDNTYIHSNEFLSFVPLKELQMNGYKIECLSSSYSRDVLNCVKYCMINNFYLDQLNNPLNNPPAIASFLGGIADSLVLNQWYNYIYYKEIPQKSLDYDYVNILDIDLYNGAPVVYNGAYITGIVISNPDIKNIDRYKNTGIIVRSECIINLLNEI